MASVAKQWAASLAPDATPALAALRLLPDVEVAETADALWLRGSGDEAPRHVPWTQRFELHDAGRLREPGCELFFGFLPEARWSPLHKALPVELPALNREGFAPSAVAPFLVRESGAAAHPAMLEINLDAWLTFAESAPAIRMQRLRYAQSDTGRIFITGAPLPSLPGTRFSMTHGIAVPCGMSWRPAVPATALRSALELGNGETLVLFADGGCLRIPHRAWTAAQRSTIRANAH